MATKFLYMDEQYIDPRTYRRGQEPQPRPCVLLTGILVSSDNHRNFRNRYYDAVAAALDRRPGFVPVMPEVHASRLFPDKSDDVKFRFLETIASIGADLGFRVFRVGYFETRETIAVFKERKALLGMCFLGLLSCIRDELTEHSVWPVMETDNSSAQDRLFAGFVQNIDYYTSILGGKNISIDNHNLGELLYSTKRSAYGSTIDCICYLLNAKSSRSSGYPCSPFKTRLAEIAARLEPLIGFDEIIELKVEKPPPSHISTGPIRYAYRIEPSG